MFFHYHKHSTSAADVKFWGPSHNKAKKPKQQLWSLWRVLNMAKSECVFSVTHDYVEIPLLSVFTVWTEHECVSNYSCRNTRQEWRTGNYTHRLFGCTYTAWCIKQLTYHCMFVCICVWVLACVWKRDSGRKWGNDVQTDAVVIGKMGWMEKS